MDFCPLCGAPANTIPFGSLNPQHPDLWSFDREHVIKDAVSLVKEKEVEFLLKEVLAYKEHQNLSLLRTALRLTLGLEG